MFIINAQPDSSKTVAYTGTAGTTGTFSPGATAVLVVCTTTAYVRINGTATTDDIPVVANFPIIIRLADGNPFTVSAIQFAAGGSLIAQPITGATI